MNILTKAPNVEIITVKDQVFSLELSDVDEIFELRGVLKYLFFNNHLEHVLNIENIKIILNQIFINDSPHLHAELLKGLQELVDKGILIEGHSESGDNLNSNFYKALKLNFESIKSNFRDLLEQEPTKKVACSEAVEDLFAPMGLDIYGLY